MKATIVCGFPGVGKTTAEAENRFVEDIESHCFQFEYNPETGPTAIPVQNWVGKYVDFIEHRADEFAGCLLVSCHKEVREELRRRGIPFIDVVPDYYPETKNAYMIRYLRRGSGTLFLKKINDNWHDWLNEIDAEPEPKIKLGPNDYISEILPR